MVVQAEAVAATAHNGVRPPLLPSTSPSMAAMWSTFPPIPNPSDPPFINMDYMNANNLFPVTRDFPLPDLSPTDVDNRGDFMFPTNDASGKTNGLGPGNFGNNAMISPDLSPPTTNNKEFDFSMGVGGDYNQSKALPLSNTRGTDENQVIPAQPLPSPGSSSWMSMFSQRSGGQNRRASYKGQTGDQNNGDTTRGYSRD